MASIITIPDFDFSAFYYPQILEALIQFKRTNAPELTDESKFEPTIQIMRAFALVGHLNNTTLDVVANESTLPTAKLVETVRNMLRLIDYELSPATPAQTDLLYELSKVFETPYEVIKKYSQAATKKQTDNSVIFFETTESITVTPTNFFTKVFSYVPNSDTFTERTNAVNDPTPGQSFEMWNPSVLNNMLYFGHDSVMWDKLEIAIPSEIVSALHGVWEYREAEWRRTAPTSITVAGIYRFDLTSLFGEVDRSGATVRVQLNSSGASAEGTVYWNGSINYVDLDPLGANASEEPTDYTVGADWLPLEVLSDETEGLKKSGDVEFSLPQTDTMNWVKSFVNDVEAYWVRFRLISPPTGAMSFDYAKMSTGKQYVLSLATQGKVFTQAPLASSSGLPDQSYELAKDSFIWDSETLNVEGETWARVDNFLGSESGDKHYTVTLGSDDRATIAFGNGATGKIPPVGASNIEITYRYDSSDDGNVGARTVVIDKTGLTFVDSVVNPRQANGWQEAQGASEESLEKAKNEGPASIRTKDVAIGPDDVEQLTIAYKDNGARPYIRARAFEEGFGPKTVEVVLVPAGGGLASQEQLNAIELYFNGDKNIVPKLPKRIVANQQVGARNYTQRVIDVEATVYGDVEKKEIKASLTALLHPEALKENGIEWLWQFGGIVPSSRISHEIFETNNTVTKVVLADPLIDVDTQLGERELPKIGTITLNIVTP